MAPRPKPVDWIAIEGLYRSGTRSTRDIANEYGLSHEAIRKRARKDGWTKDPTGTKRELVKARLTGCSNGSQLTAATIDAEAGRDVADMNLGLNGARAILQSAVDSVQLQGVHTTEDGRKLELVIDPKDLKILSECIKINIETIRKIRGLDDPEEAKLPEPMVIGVQAVAVAGEKAS